METSKTKEKNKSFIPAFLGKNQEKRKKYFNPHTRKDTLTKPKEWAKHLRPFGKKQEAKTERQASKKQIEKENHH